MKTKCEHPETTVRTIRKGDEVAHLCLICGAWLQPVKR